MDAAVASRLSLRRFGVALLVAGCGGRSVEGTPRPTPPSVQVVKVPSAQPPGPTPPIVCPPAKAPAAKTAATANADRSDPSAQLVVSEGPAGQDTFEYLGDGSRLLHATPSLVTVYETERFEPVLRIKPAYTDDTDPPRVEYLPQAPDGIIVRSCFYDRFNECVIEAYDLATGKKRFRVAYGAEYRQHFDVAPSGQVFSASAGGSILVWDARTGRQKWRWPHPNPQQGKVVFDPTGARAAIPYPGGVELRSLKTGARLGYLGNSQPTLDDPFGPDAEAIFDASGTKLYVDSPISDGLEVWDVTTKRHLTDIIEAGLTHGVYAQASTLVVYDGPYLVFQINTATDQLVEQRQLGNGRLDPVATAIAWEAHRAAYASDDGATVLDLSTGNEHPFELAGSAWELALSPRGDQLVAGSKGAPTKVIDLATGRTLKTFDKPNAAAPELLALGQRYWVTRADDKTSLWDLARESHVATVQTVSQRAALAPDESWVALHEATGIEVRCTSDPTLKWRAALDADWLAFSEKSHVLVSSKARSLQAYDTRAQKLIWQKSVDNAPRGLHVVGAALIVDGEQGNAIAIDIESGRLLPNFSIPHDEVSTGATEINGTFPCATGNTANDCSLLARPPGKHWTDLWRAPALTPFVQLVSVDDRLLAAREVVSAPPPTEVLDDEERYPVRPASSGKHYLIGRAQGSAVSCVSGTRPLPLSACARRIGAAPQLVGGAR